MLEYEKNENIIHEFIESYYFIPESGNIFKNNKVSEIKTIVPDDFLTAYNKLKPKEGFLIGNDEAFFTNLVVSFAYKKTPNGYVLKQVDREGNEI